MQVYTNYIRDGYKTLWQLEWGNKTNIWEEPIALYSEHKDLTLFQTA